MFHHGLGSLVSSISSLRLRGGVRPWPRSSGMAQHALNSVADDAPGIVTLAPDLPVLATTQAAENVAQRSGRAERQRSQPVPVGVLAIEPASRAELEPVIATGFCLTPREAAIMTLVLRGMPSKSIANSLRITVNDHITSIFAKTRVNSRGQLMATVFRERNAPHRRAIRN